MDSIQVTHVKGRPTECKNTYTKSHMSVPWYHPSQTSSLENIVSTWVARCYFLNNNRAEGEWNTKYVYYGAYDDQMFLLACPHRMVFYYSPNV